MLLESLLARATGLPGYDLWRGLAPRRFLTEVLLADVLRSTEVLPGDHENGVFAVVTTSPFGLPKTLPAGWSELGSVGEYFATFRTPAGTTAQEVREALALELIPLFYPSNVYEEKLFTWLARELGPEDEAEEGALPAGPEPDAPGPRSAFDTPSPDNYENPRSEEEQDLDYLYGNGSTPPEYRRYRNHSRSYESAAQLDPTYGPPEVSDLAIQEAEEAAFYFG